MLRHSFQSSAVVLLTFLRTNVVNVRVKNQCDHNDETFHKEDRM